MTLLKQKNNTKVMVKMCLCLGLRLNEKNVERFRVRIVCIIEGEVWIDIRLHEDVEDEKLHQPTSYKQNIPCLSYHLKSKLLLYLARVPLQ